MRPARQSPRQPLLGGRGVALACALALLACLGSASSAAAVELPPYELDPTLSLTGNCATGKVDPVADPSCPYPAPPGGPVGRFNAPIAIAIDSFGDEYVSSYAAGDPAKGHVDVFDDEGKFVTEAAIPNSKRLAVNSKGNLYVFKDTSNVFRYPPSEYKPEEGKIKYENPAVLVSAGTLNVGSIAIDTATDQLIVARPDVITRYKSAEEGNGELESFEPSGLGTWVEAVAVDAQRRRIYTVTCKNATLDCRVMVIDADAPHAILEEIDGSTTPGGVFASTQGWLPVAVDEETGDFFVADPSAKRVYQFDEHYEYLSQIKFGELLTAIQIAVSNGKRSPAAEACKYPDPEDVEVPVGDACNRHYLFVPLRNEVGNAFAFHPPAQTPPLIEGVATGSIGQSEAELRATIFPGGLKTEYAFEVTPQASFEAEGFAGATVLGKGTISSEGLATEVIAHAMGLAPGQSYRFRVVASNELGKAAEEGQNEAGFTTYDDASAPGPCPNDALRSGASAGLPDCRAYELVTPPDTNGRAPKGSLFAGGRIFTTTLSSPSGEALYFRVEGGSLGGTTGNGGFQGGDPYVARRTAAGWGSALEGPSGEEATAVSLGSESVDQGYSFFTARLEGPLIVNGEEAEYVRYPDGHPELTGRGSIATDPKAAGQLIAEDGTHIVFETIAGGGTFPIQLEPDAPPTGTRAVYDRTPDEVTHVVSLLPGDVTPAAGQDATYLGASKDGNGIAFAIGSTLYLRKDNSVTYEIGENVDVILIGGIEQLAFAGVSEGGGRIFYLEGGDLKAFDTTTESVIDFSESGDVTPVNVASGGSRAYFVSPSVLSGEGNPRGALPQAGKQNLYLSEEGQISFVGTVTDRDVKGEIPPSQSIPTDGLGLWTQVGAQLAEDPSRLNPDGSVLLFQSRANLTGQGPGKSPQVFRYDRSAERLECISCNPIGQAPAGGASLETYTFDPRTPPPLSPNGFLANQTPDGKRAFFESTEALVSTDTDGVQDVYEWEEEGVGSCKREGGCVYLISSGKSAHDNYLYAQSSDGRDVFFSTEDRLSAEDPSGTRSIYDARIGGGFAPSSPAGECLGEACQAVVVAPTPTSPASATFRGQGNVEAAKARARCPKGKRRVSHRGKSRCVAKHQPKKHHRKRAQAKRKAAQ